MALRCTLFGHRWASLKDYSECPPGHYQLRRRCSVCHAEESMGPECGRDDAKWAALKVEEQLVEEGGGDELP